MHPQMLDDKKGAWPLNVPKPTAIDLMDWAIRLNPSKAESSPEEAIKNVIALYMRAGEASAKWEQLSGDYAHEEIRRLEGTYIVASIGKEDTMIKWLEDNTEPTEENVRFKTPGKLLAAIHEMSEKGVATERIENSDGTVFFRIRKLYGGHSYRSEKTGLVIILPLRIAKDFLELRRIKRDKEAWQAEWKKIEASKIASKSEPESSKKHRNLPKLKPLPPKK